MKEVYCPCRTSAEQYCTTVFKGERDVQEPWLSLLRHPVSAQAALGREQYPEDLVGTVLFLASEDSDFVTGQNFTVDGGVAHW